MDPNTIATAMPGMRPPAGPAEFGAQLKIDIQGLDHGGGAQFRAALDRHAGGMGGVDGIPGAGAKGGANSLGNALATRTTTLATEVKKDQQYVSRLLETATRSGDKVDLMRAMMALSDFQMRVQTISKVVSKAATSIDALTKLQ